MIYEAGESSSKPVPGGNIAYVFADELPLFAAAYSKDRKTLSFEEVELLELLEQEGPMTVAVMKELTGHLAKQLTPVLHRLQQKFLVFEDQVDNEWDRAWYLFETEFPDINLKQFTKTEAIKELVMRFAFLNVFIKPDMLASFYRFKAEDTNRAVAELAEEGKLVNRESAANPAVSGRKMNRCSKKRYPRPNRFSPSTGTISW